MEKAMNLPELSQMNTFKRLLIFLGLVFFYSDSRFEMNSGNDFIAANQVLVWVVSLILFAALLLVLVKLFGLKLAANPFTWKKIGILFLGLIAWFAFTAFYKWLEMAGYLAVSANQIGLQSVPYWATIFAGSIEAPLIEELLFRGFFFKYFFQKNTKRDKFLLVFVSGLLFGFMHMLAGFDLANWLVYSAMGWLLGVVRLTSGDVKLGMVIHCLNNSMWLL